MKKEKLNVLITHVYSPENKGDAALLSVLIHDINQAHPDNRIEIAITAEIKKNATYEGYPLIPSAMYVAMSQYSSNVLTLLYALYVVCSTLLYAFVKKLLKLELPLPQKLKTFVTAIEEASIVIAVGGGYMRGQNKGVGSFLYVALILHVFCLAKILSKKVILYSQSIGPFSNSFEEKVVAWTLNSCANAVLVREDTSKKLLDRIGVTTRTLRSVDSGFAFEPAKEVHIDLNKKFSIPKDKVLVGITAKRYTKGALQDRYEKEMATALDKIGEGFEVAFIFIPQVTASFNNDDDRQVHSRIHSLMKNNTNAFLINDDLSHHEIKNFYNSLDLIIGTRFHSVIFALTSFVPAIAIEYEHKTSGIMKDLDLEEWVLDINTFTAEQLVTSFNSLHKTRKQYKEQLQKIIPPYKQKAHDAIKIVEEVINTLN